MLLFMRPEEVEQVRGILRDYAMDEDHGELITDKARKARFHAESIDPEKGSATGYVAKYISKILMAMRWMMNWTTKAASQ